jgi:hypothetical protein
MAITQFTRFKSDKPEEMVKRAKQAKTIFEKHGAEFLRLSRFHTGVWAGEWLVVTRYASWEVYGKVQEAVAKDPEFAQLLANTATISQLMGRNIAVGVDLWKIAKRPPGSPPAGYSFHGVSGTAINWVIVSNAAPAEGIRQKSK